MSPETREWIDKAEADFETAKRESRARKLPNHDAVCFHAQQYAEKYFKARLDRDGLAIPKTHDLNRLLGLVLPANPDWGLLRAAAETLTDFAVRYRYPGAWAGKEEATQSMKCGKLLRSHVRARLTLTDVAAKTTRRRSGLPMSRRKKPQ